MVLHCLCSRYPVSYRACPLALLLLAASCAAIDQTAAPATPQRPTLSPDTNTVPGGLFELEFGVVRDSTISFDSPLTLRYGLEDTTEVSAGFAPYRRVADHFGVFGEVAAVIVPASDVENVFTTLGGTYSPRPSLVFDAAIVVGLSNDAINRQALIGLTANLGSLGTGRRP